MGFDEITNMFLPKNNVSLEQIKKHLQKPQTVDSRSHLIQGVRLHNVREGFEDNTKTFRKIDQKEKKLLKDLSNNYHQLVSDYATAYQGYLEEHLRLTQSVENCKTKCADDFNKGQNYANKQRACAAGCDLKGVQVLKCKNTYKGLSSDTSKKCKDVAVDHCDDGTINPGNTSKNFVNSADNSDSGSITVAQGCCMCGGGTGGKPTAYVNGTTIRKCNEIGEAMGDTDMIQFCKNAGTGVAGFSASNNANFVNRYADIKSKNTDAMNEAKKLKGKIGKLITTRDKLKGSIAGEEDSLEQNLKNFEEKYSKLQGYGETGKDWTSIAQYHTTLNKKNSEELKFYMWSVLAIVLIMTVVSNFKKKS